MAKYRPAAGIAMAVLLVSVAVHAQTELPPQAAVSQPVAAAPSPFGPAGGDPSLFVSETDTNAPVDYGPGPGKRRPAGGGRPPAPGRQFVSAPVGGSTASTGGLFGAVTPWPIIPIHVVLLPDGRVMSYGTNETGQQGAQLVYDVWDPTQGTVSSSHMTLPNSTSTDIFCSGQSMMWGSGLTLITGGDLTVNGVRNFSNNHTTIFDPGSNTISSGTSMQYPRWYASIVPLPDGEMLVLGGRSDKTTSVLTPEVFNPSSGWRTLTGANSSAAFTNYYYPRGYVAPAGNVFMMTSGGQMYNINPAGAGTITKLRVLAPLGYNTLPTLMYAQGELLSVRANAAVVTVNINGATPVVTPTASLSQVRYWASTTLLPDGTVLVTGGSLVANKLTGVAYQSEIWNPATGQWTIGASATKPRLYHSNALLLPDGSVLTGGGGAPGPVKNLNVELYYPPYFYLPSGQLAPRPTLVSAPGSARVGQNITATVGSTDSISRVTFLRSGSSTHANNLEQRFLDLPFSQSGQTVTATLPGNNNVLLPGYWLLFVWQGNRAFGGGYRARPELR